MQIEMLKTSELIPYEKNPRKNDAAVDKVAASIKEFGFLVPIVIDRNNEIAAGHTRLKAALQLGIDRVPCVRANDLTDDQIKAFRLADNKTAEFAEWDFTELDKQLEELMNTEIDMTRFGFTFDEDPPEITEDEPPEVNERAEPVTNRGDVWLLGEHRLMCGDSTSKDDFDKLCGGGVRRYGVHRSSLRRRDRRQK